ncbi:MAG: hypothetical protein QM765_33570 [Myxococcales bacterium]
MAKKTAAAAAQKLGVIWTKAQRKRVFGSVEPLAIDEPPMSRDEAWAELHSRYQKAHLFRGKVDTHARTEKVLEALAGELLQDTPPKLTADPLREFLRYQLVADEAELPKERWDVRRHRVLEACLALWDAELGLPFAAELVVRTFPVGCGLVTCGDERRVTVKVGGDVSSQVAVTGDMPLLLLRRRVLAAAPEAYAAAQTKCQEIVGGPFAKERMGLLNVFCRDPRELHDLVAKFAKPVTAGSGPGRHAPNLSQLLSGIFDPELAATLARSVAHNYASLAPPHAFNLVDNLGKAAAPVLVELLERVSSGDRQPLADAAALADIEVARAAVLRLNGPAKTALGKAID